MMDGKMQLWSAVTPPRRGELTPRASPSTKREDDASRPSFQNVLRGRMRGDLRFSAHAQARLEQRGIHFEQEDLEHLREAVNRAERKGIRSSLVLSDKAALVVSVSSRTVITAVAPVSMQGTVFSNIDGAVFVKEEGG